MYFIISDVEGYIEEKNVNKYLTFASADTSKKVVTKYTELWDGTKNLIDKINDKPGEHEKDFMKIKFNSDDNLPSNEVLKLHTLTVIIRSVFKEDNKYHPEVFLDEYLY